MPECSDCNLSTLDTLPCTECWDPKGVMFDVTSSQDISIESLNVQLSSGRNYIVVYTSPGNYSDKVTDPSQWTRVYTNSFEGMSEFKLLAECIFEQFTVVCELNYCVIKIAVLLPDNSTVTLDIDNIELRAGSFLAFYVASTDRIVAGGHSNNTLDGVLTILGPSRYVNSGGGLFGSDGSDDIAW